MKKIHVYSSLTIILLVALSSCSKKDPAVATVLKQWNIALSSKFENPAPASRNETGTVALTLLSDNSLTYTITVNNLASGDVLSAAHLHVGDVITSGGIVLPLTPVFNGSTGTGTTTSLRSTLVDSLMDDSKEIYFNIHSAQVGSGLVRGQLNTNIEMAADVVLSGANEVPVVTTTATGLALVRLTSKKILYTRIAIANLEAGDAMSVAHIHKAAAGTNGGVITGIYGTAAEFGTVKILTVDDLTFASLKADAIYVNAHSVNKPGGIVRGQIR